MNTYKENNQEYTDYQFVIKNGIKFSDGQPLTIKDVIFNLYVYLDPVYTGSATMYSTKIVGLNDYRTQVENVEDNAAESMEAGYRQDAQERIDNLIIYVYHESRYTANDDRPSIGYMTDEDIAKAKEDFVTVGKTFLEELASDWNAISSSMDSYVKTNGFTAPWQVFLVNDGGLDLYQHNPDDTLKKDEDGNYLFDPNGDETKTCENDLKEYLSDNNITATSGQEYDNAVREWAIDYVYNNFFGTQIENTSGTQFELVARYWGTASTILEQFTAEAKSEYFSSFTNGLNVPSIRGITTAKGSAFKPSAESSSSTASYSNEYDVLQIKIKGVDPKAIYN
ncbi:MAG: hypothetical protein K2H43_03100, partial [Clostridia bacterium]|nr:hypothetical protein [Clostridia bacterium]